MAEQGEAAGASSERPTKSDELWKALNGGKGALVGVTIPPA
jgi:hypothetical protein